MPPPEAPSNEPLGPVQGVEPSQIVDAARGYVGVPYRYGGESSGGMDCSGLVYRVFNDRGIAMPRTSGEQFSMGRPVDVDQLRAGDLVFFTDARGQVDHVGICTDRRHFLHASTSRRRVVEDSVDSNYFRNRFAGARRLIGR